MSLYRSPAVALMPDLTPKPLRSKGNAIINLMGAVGGVMALGFITVMVPKTENPDYTAVFAAAAIVMVVSVTILALTIRENKMAVKDEPEEKERAENVPQRGLSAPEKRSLVLILASVFFWFMGYNAVTTAFSKYARAYWGLTGGAFAYTLIIAQAAAICAYLPVAALSQRIGRRKTILCGVTGLTLAFGAAVFFRSFNYGMFALFALAGISWAAINVNSYPMVVELAKGSGRGKIHGLLLYFLHGGADYYPHPLRLPAGKRGVSHAVPLRCGVRRGIVLYDAFRASRRCKNREVFFQIGGFCFSRRLILTCNEVVVISQFC